MPAFKRVTREDLTRLTRAELLRRMEAESAYWDRKCKRGLSEMDVATLLEFGAIMRAAFNPVEALDHAIQSVEGREDSGYWDEKPGNRSQ
ncbi:hypothetical protein ACFU9B_42325 [Streptomyces sp. NPDC057592]|uniref:hypothetical protein n=1 Tax=unclassified Streptomyces TaxID=2593676 RepID=UPI0036AAAA5B